MKPNRTRLLVVAAALSTVAIAGPVSTAGAATTHRAAAAAEREAGHGPGVTGSTYITTAPTTFINDNNQVSDGNTSLGNQTAV